MWSVENTYAPHFLYVLSHFPFYTSTVPLLEDNSFGIASQRYTRMINDMIVTFPIVTKLHSGVLYLCWETHFSFVG